jgi:hypothetical protein
MLVQVVDMAVVTTVEVEVVVDLMAVDLTVVDPMVDNNEEVEEEE